MQILMIFIDLMMQILLMDGCNVMKILILLLLHYIYIYIVLLLILIEPLHSYDF
jgi:hypothetical protein